MFTVHHLGMSQSERIVWLCEELGLEYNLEIYKRDPLLAPASLKRLPGNDIGTAPVLQDGDVTLTESGAIVEWIIHRHGNGRLACRPDDANYAQYLRWFHFSNATLQSQIGRIMMLGRLGESQANEAVKKSTWDRLSAIFSAIDHQLGKTSFLAGDALTAADIMTVFSLSTMRYFVSFDLSEYGHIVRYLKMISEREAYRSAMRKGDQGMSLVMTAAPPKQTLFEMLKGQNAPQQSPAGSRTASKLS
jgi:glutathione S-transferase